MRKRVYLVLVLALLSTVGVAGLGGVAEAQDERVVLAFYYGWFDGASWGDGRLADHPAEPYSSSDRGAMARQISQAQSAGIDAFVMGWYGPESGINSSILASLMDQAAAQGFRVAVDVDLGAGFNSTFDSILLTMRDLIANRIHHPAYFRYQGKPVIFFWNQGRFSPAQWADIRAQVDPSHDTIWMAEGASALDYLPTFDGLHLYNIAWSGNPAQTAATWAQRAQQAGAYFAATAMPGWDDTRMGRGEAGFATARNNGAFLRTSFSGAAAANPHLIVITSWNEYFENSHIEPSQAYGSFYLDLTRGLIAAYKSGGTAPAAPAGGAVAPAAPTGAVAIPTVGRLNVRQAPSISAARLSQVMGGGRYPILGRNGDGTWWLVDFGGGQGWIAARYARYEGGDINAVPVSEAVGGAAPAPSAPVSGGSPTGLIVVAQYNVRVRNAPGTHGAVINIFPWRAQAELVGRNGGGGWLMINYGGVIGWVAADLVIASGDVNVAPITG